MSLGDKLVNDNTYLAKSKSLCRFTTSTFSVSVLGSAFVVLAA